jgi:hypothetical protein
MPMNENVDAHGWLLAFEELHGKAWETGSPFLDLIAKVVAERDRCMETALRWDRLQRNGDQARTIRLRVAAADAALRALDRGALVNALEAMKIVVEPGSGLSPGDLPEQSIPS